MKGYLSILLAISLILVLSSLVLLLYSTDKNTSEKSTAIKHLYDAELTSKRSIIETARVASSDSFVQYNLTHKKAFCRHCKSTCRKPCDFEKYDPELYSVCMLKHESTKYARKGIDNFCDASFCNDCFLDECAKEISAYSATSSIYSLLSTKSLTDFDIQINQTQPTTSILYLACNELGQTSLESLPKHSSIVPYNIKSEIDQNTLRLKFDKDLSFGVDAFYGVNGQTKIPKNYPIFEMEMGQ